MKKLIVSGLALLMLSSCATIFSGSKAKITVTDDEMLDPVDITADGKRVRRNVYLPVRFKVKRGFRPSTVKVEANGYETETVTVYKKFNAAAVVNLTNLIAWGIDAATGAMMKPEEKVYHISMKREPSAVKVPYVAPVQDPTIPAGAAGERVNRDNAGKTNLERTILRWFFDSDPQGARIFWRVISSVPDEVKNTNETYLMTTPFEETRSFNIQGLTYENARDVQVEIKLMKPGYEPQVKRFNVRQAIDQQEISSFFMMVKKGQE